MDSSWKLDSSSTHVEQFGVSANASRIGTPMLPAARASGCTHFANSTANAVVVVLPLDPVIANTDALAGTSRANNSMSPSTGTPCCKASLIANVARGTPGESAMKSEAGRVSPQIGRHQCFECCKQFYAIKILGRACERRVPILSPFGERPRAADLGCDVLLTAHNRVV